MTAPQHLEKVSLITQLKSITKTLIAIAGLATEAVNAGLVPASDQKWVGIGIAAITTLFVYVFPNTPIPPPPPL